MNMKWRPCGGGWAHHAVSNKWCAHSGASGGTARPNMLNFRRNLGGSVTPAVLLDVVHELVESSTFDEFAVDRAPVFVDENDVHVCRVFLRY